MWYKNKFYTDDEFTGAIEMVYMTIEDCMWKCADGHYLTTDELETWSDEKLMELFEMIYPEYIK